MARIGDVVNLPRCEDCGKPLRDSRYSKCYECSQRARESGGRSAGPSRQFESYLSRLAELGYFEKRAPQEKPRMRRELITEEADMVARTLADAGVAAGPLRRFFTRARYLEQRLGEEGWDAVANELTRFDPLVTSLVGRAANSQQRQGLELLRKFVCANVALAEDSEENFRKGFVPHFESVIAYFTYYKPR